MTINRQFKTELRRLVAEYHRPKRTAITKQYPILKTPVLRLRQAINTVRVFFDRQVKYQKSEIFLPSIIARHQSVLMRRLGDSEERLQKQKITNLHQAIAKLNQVVIPAGKIFSLWTIVGRPNIKNGYVNGMLLSGGKIQEGVGGGLCQLSNLLYWLFLHAKIEIVERHHHSFDVFPDSGRVLPFGGGATIMYNLLDLKIKNISSEPIQIKLWLTDKHLKGQILSTQPAKSKFNIIEKNHLFIKDKTNYFRYNEIWREEKINGAIIKTEKISTNLAPVLYLINNKYLKENNFTVIKL